MKVRAKLFSAPTELGVNPRPFNMLEAQMAIWAGPVKQLLLILEDG
jgi:hypothetical protein